MACEPDTTWLCGLEYIFEPQDYVLQYSRMNVQMRIVDYAGWNESHVGF